MNLPLAFRSGLVAGWLVSGLLVYPGGVGWAQGQQGSAVANDNLLKENPRLADVMRTRPDMLSPILLELAPLSEGRQSPLRGDGDGAMGSTRPTAEEAAQLARNPAFAAAFRQNPTETLSLLRYINELLGL